MGTGGIGVMGGTERRIGIRTDYNGINWLREGD